MTPQPVDASQQSAAERSTPARLGAVLFRHRGWLPVVFLGVPLLARGTTTPWSWGVGLALVGLGELWRLTGVAAAGTKTRRRSRDVQRLVTYGPFALSRNPLYNGNFFIWMGFVVVSGVYWFLPVAIVIFAIEYSLIVAYEEGVLESIFREHYLAYKKLVPRWIPQYATTPPVPGEAIFNWSEAWRSESSTFIQYVVLLGVLWLKSHYWH